MRRKLITVLLSGVSSSSQVSWTVTCLSMFIVITGTAVSFVAVDTSIHQLQEPKHWPTFCSNMFYAVLWCAGTHLYDRTGNWRRYSSADVRLYSDAEWRHCMSGPVVLELWQTQEERLGRNTSCIQRMFLAVIFLLVLGGLKKNASTFFF